VKLVDSWPEVVRISSECDVKWFQEFVHPDKKILRTAHERDVHKPFCGVLLKWPMSKWIRENYFEYAESNFAEWQKFYVDVYSQRW